ncbi:MAG: DUF1003 domain-containing protein [Acidimicrobiia bacterium]|nr:DUF1003 domain-containing protein [Acidimicrobiia bacterium]
MTEDVRRFHQEVQHVHGPFGTDAFGRRAEAFARFFGTPRFLIGQTVLVGLWIVVNVMAVSMRWDPYPFILLNLAFSLQAAYAAPLILLAQTRQADRDKALSEADTNHRDALARATVERQEIAAQQTARLRELLEANTRLTEQVERLTKQIHARVVSPATGLDTEAGG